MESSSLTFTPFFEVFWGGLFLVYFFFPLLALLAVLSSVSSYVSEVSYSDEVKLTFLSFSDVSEPLELYLFFNMDLVYLHGRGN
ncbi:hypothetical protein GDO81_010767 [Engystomops pustulosus]|uniref:ATP synthase F0 subunit 8 n=1 Tax=Engystomops pustulosus TaxID=76066 RepID=A0AAV7C458_ENGPU|nr:hypothetical protein GDO81_010767 [Engystomops pustulosus]